MDIIDQIHELILEDRRISAKSIVEQLGISRERVGSIIHEDLDTLVSFLVGLRTYQYPCISLGEAEVWFHAFLTQALDGGDWSTSRPYHFEPGKKRRYILNSGWRGSRDILGDAEKCSSNFILNLSHKATQPKCWHDQCMKDTADITSQCCHHIDSTA